jgi:hypothetical protein
MAMNDLLLNLEKITGKRGICHNADSDDKIKQKLIDTNKEWVNYDFFISTNVVTVGLNFDVKYFHQVYLIYLLLHLTGPGIWSSFRIELEI